MRGLAQGNIADNLQRETLERCYFGGMVRQQLYTTQPQVMKDLRAHTIVAVYSVARFQARFTLADVLFLHHGVSAQLIHEIKTMLALSQIKNHTLARGGDFFQSCMKLKSGVID